MKSEVEIYEAIARGWCHDTNSSKEMDSLLGEAIVIEVLEVVRPLVAERDEWHKEAFEWMHMTDELTKRWNSALAERDALAAKVAAWIDRCYQQQERADKAEEARDALAALSTVVEPAGSLLAWINAHRDEWDDWEDEDLGLLDGIRRDLHAALEEGEGHGKA